MPADKSLNLLAQQQQPSNASAVITAAPRDIRIVYPNDKEGLKVTTSSTFIVGACPPQAELLCNGEKIRLNEEGYFAHVVSLAPGANTFVVTEVGHPDENQTFKIVRDLGRTPIPANKFELAIDTVQPAEDLGVASGDKVELSVPATPGAEVYAIIGGKKILLRSFAASHAAGKGRAVRRRTTVSSNVNLGMDVTYGKVFQKSSPASSDLYAGFYKVTPDDHWKSVPVRFSLKTSSKSTTLAAKSHVTTITQPSLAQTVHDATIVRVSPGGSRITPLPQGVRLLVMI